MSPVRSTPAGGAVARRAVAISSLLLATLLASGCQTWRSTWSEVTGQRYSVNVQNRRPAIIDRVDDAGAFPNADIVRVTPGEHRLIVQGPAPGWTGGPPLHVMVLTVAPCRRYYINAQVENATTQAWVPVVDYVETIEGCVAPAMP
jgi:hypothetical protein